MPRISFRNKKIAILGASVEGLDSSKFFISEGAWVYCCDRRSYFEVVASQPEFRNLNLTFITGPKYLENLNQFELIVRTPGMNINTHEIVKAQKHGQEVTTLTKLFFKLCEAPIIGVTGTKGKGTTTTLIGEMFRSFGFTTYVGGNVGIPLLSIVRTINPLDHVVLELSSFQLEDMTQSPHIAVLLNITQDHLANSDPNATNYHKTLDLYRAAKAQIVNYQTQDDYCVINADYEVSQVLANNSRAQKLYFSKTMQVKGAYVENNRLILSIDAALKQVIDVSKLKLRGRHNWENVLAATVVAGIEGISIVTMRQVLTEFKGLEHRLEFVQEINGVKYYNDSFSTTPETAIAAIKTFCEPIILIVGGSDKGANYSILAETIINARVKSLIYIGEMGSKIVMEVENLVNKNSRTLTTRFTKGGNTMEEIVSQAQKLAETGDVVVLSPACASFDMFANYMERGRLFKYYVHKIPKK